MITPTLDPHALAAQLGAHHLIDGQLVPGEQTFTVYNPATLKDIAQAAAGDAAVVDQAVRSARAAQSAWGAMKAELWMRAVNESRE